MKVGLEAERSAEFHRMDAEVRRAAHLHARMGSLTAIFLNSPWAVKLVGTALDTSCSAVPPWLPRKLHICFLRGALRSQLRTKKALRLSPPRESRPVRSSSSHPQTSPACRQLQNGTELQNAFLMC